MSSDLKSREVPPKPGNTTHELDNLIKQKKIKNRLWLMTGTAAQ